MKWPNVDFGVCRYVVLHHTGVDEPHFDFLFETSGESPLVTFRLPEWPPKGDGRVTRLKDHRRSYLQFEGVIAGSRGSVKRIEEGELWVTESASGWLLRRPDGSFYALFEPHGRPHAETQPNWWVTLPAGTEAP